MRGKFLQVRMTADEHAAAMDTARKGGWDNASEMARALIVGHRANLALYPNEWGQSLTLVAHVPKAVG